MNFVVTLLNPSGAAVSSSSYLPSLSPLNTASLLLNTIVSVSSAMNASSPLGCTDTPLSEGPAAASVPSIILRVNSALLSSASGFEPNASLLISIVDISSRIRIVPSSLISTLPVVVGTSLTTTLPSAISNVNLETTVYPSGAVSSIRVYVPSFRPSNLVSLLVNVYAPFSISSAVIAVSFTRTPSRSSPLIVNLATCFASVLS